MKNPAHPASRAFSSPRMCLRTAEEHRLPCPNTSRPPEHIPSIILFKISKHPLGRAFITHNSHPWFPIAKWVITSPSHWTPTIYSLHPTSCITQHLSPLKTQQPMPCSSCLLREILPQPPGPVALPPASKDRFTRLKDH